MVKELTGLAFSTRLPDLRGMSMPQTARQILRLATAADHERVDAAFGGYALADRDDYRAFLSAQAAALLPVEAAIDRGDWRAILPDWPERRRSAAVLADLAALGAQPSMLEAAPELPTPAHVLGAVYVLEGSRLGGQMLARAVPPEFPRAFLGDAHSARWRSLIALLDKSLVSDEQRAAAVSAASQVFAVFEGGARRHARTKCL